MNQEKREILDNCSEQGDDSPTQTVEQLLQEISTLSEESRERLFEALQRKGECSCGNNSFPHDTRKPAYEAALRYYHIAQEIAQKKEEERKKKIIAARRIIKLIIMRSMTAKRRNYQKRASNLAEKIAHQLINIKGIKIQDIVATIEAYAGQIAEECKTKGNIVRNGAQELNELIHLFDARQPIKPYLRKLIMDASDLRELDLSKIWREKAAANGNNGPEAQAAIDSIKDLGDAANTYCSTFFNPYSLHPEVTKVNNLQQLCEIVEHTLPLNVDSWQKYVSAVAKINMMHLVETIRSQVDFDEMRAASQHLEKLINARKVRLPDMRELLTCGDPENPRNSNSVVVESIRVAAEKSEVAAARKYMDKGSENTKDYDAYNINDWVRFSIMLTKKDSQDSEKTELATVKIIAILCSLFGTDIPHERLRYALESGGTNPNSTGKHEAFHLTLRYRYQCGTNRDQVRTIKIEAQIQKYMDSDESREDHDDYVRKKDQKNTRIAGMNVTFYQLVTDLSDYLLSEQKTLTTAEFYKNAMKRPEKERMALVLFMILTKKDKDGELENGKILRELFADDLQRRKIETLVERYKKHVPFQHQKRGIIDEESNSSTLINRLAKEADRIFQELDLQHSSRQL